VLGAGSRPVTRGSGSASLVERTSSLRETAPDPHEETVAALMAHAAGRDLHEIRSIGERRGGLLRRLEKFSFPLVAAHLAGLLTRPENHCASRRIEALIHLAALVCRGTSNPRPRHLRHWLNTMLWNDPIAQLEVPVEDVFVANVATLMGNARLFGGRWQGNPDHTQACVETLLRLRERPWAMETLRHVTALLQVSDSVADRAGLARNSRTTSTPRATITVTASIVSQSSRHVRFTPGELVAIGVDHTDLHPFLFEGHHAELLLRQSIGHTELERRPLVQFRGETTVALPTGIGAAVRRFVLERAAAAGDLRLFQSTHHLAQFSRAFLLGRADWDVEYLEMLEPDPDDGMREFVGAFDEDAYVHVVFVPDDFEEIAKEGLASTHMLEDAVRERIGQRAAEITRERQCRRGLTVLVHGGIGREFSPVWGELPKGWHQLCVEAPDFILLGSEAEFTAMRAWKVLEMVSELEADGVTFPNLRGFLNLVAYAYHVGFELLPETWRAGPIFLHSDFLLPLRHELRSTLDRHVAVGPDGNSWVDVERETGEYLDEARGRLVFHSRGHRAERELLACVESASRPWWLQCSQLPEGGRHKDLVFGILDLVLGWLVRLVPVLEDRYPTLPPGPVAVRVRFPAIETFRRHDLERAEAAVAPGVAVEDGGIAIDCTPQYLRSFLSSGNLGDRLMIASLLRGLDLLCDNPAVSDAELDEWVRDAIGSEAARFLNMSPSKTPEDAIYDAVALPALRLLMPEDRARSRFELARLAGYMGKPGPLPSARAVGVLNRAVDQLWQRIRSRLVDLSRESVIERSLLNYVASRKEHRDWLRSTAAQLALYDREQVMAAASDRVFRRDAAGLSCRIIAEMALCTSPNDGGALCSGTDLDYLVADVTSLLDCAGQSDALHYGLAARPPVLHPNGSFGFDESAAVAAGLLATEHWRRTFRDAAADDEGAIVSGGRAGVADPGFPSAFLAEFGLSLDQYGRFVYRLTMEALEANRASLRLRRSEVVQRLRDVGGMDSESVFGALALSPRGQWDEDDPDSAEARDWWPWRYNRRLSIMRRPLVQLSMEADPLVTVVPSILAGSLGYLHQAAFGELPDTLFDSPEMAACIGRAADRNGHQFARAVADRFGTLEWKTEREVWLTRLGGAESLGDVDVLAWRPDTGLVYAVECKSLRFDRTCGEIGERLKEYSAGTVDGKRTPLQKHLDRVSWLEANRQRLAAFVDVPVDRLRLRSALVTEQLVSMQFSGEAREVLDLVTDYELLEQALPSKANGT